MQALDDQGFDVTTLSAVSGRGGPVSYTHLDVYKRQAQGFADGGAFWSALESARELPELVVLDVMLSLIHIYRPAIRATSVSMTTMMMAFF